MNVKEWIFQWFEHKIGLSSTTLNDKINCNYFEEQWLDSFQFISFISELEKNFGIHLDNRVFQERSFTTLAGLIKTIEKHMNV